MKISFKKLMDAGYSTTVSKTHLEIYANEPMELPFDKMRELLEAHLTAFEIDCGFDAFITEVEMHQIMKAIR